MKDNLFKNLAITFIVIYLWTLSLFFHYILEEPGFLHGFGTLVLYLYSLYFGIGLGIVTLLLRIFIFKKDRSLELKNNFFYLFAGIFNLNLSIIFLFTVLFKILDINQGYFHWFALCNFLISISILIDIFTLKKIMTTNIEK
jgi:hypothetical protein